MLIPKRVILIYLIWNQDSTWNWCNVRKKKKQKKQNNNKNKAKKRTKKNKNKAKNKTKQNNATKKQQQHTTTILEIPKEEAEVVNRREVANNQAKSIHISYMGTILKLLSYLDIHVLYETMVSSTYANILKYHIQGVYITINDSYR
jgi:hypothetical protein